jgi:hypothetical protein
MSTCARLIHCFKLRKITEAFANIDSGTTLNDLAHVVLLATEEPAQRYKLFHGLYSTNQGMHRASQEQF